MFYRKPGIFALLLFGLASSAVAESMYVVTVDTSSITGASGSLDFNFEPSGLAQYASVSLLNFSTDGVLNSASIQATNDAYGMLPGTVTFDNLTGFNDYFEDFTFGTTLTFEVDFFGPAISSPGNYAAGSQFVFSIFSDAAGTMPVLTTDTTYGIALSIDLNPDGTTTPTDNSPETTIALAPEPGSLALLGSGIACFALLNAYRRRAGRAG